MDPFCVIKYQKQTFKTEVKQDAGKKPVWKQNFKFFISNIQHDICFQVKEEDVATDDLVGSVTLPVSDIISRENTDDLITLNIVFENKVSGKIMVKTSFEWPQTQ